MNIKLSSHRPSANLTDTEARTLAQPVTIIILLLNIIFLLDGTLQIYHQNPLAPKTLFYGLLSLSIIAALFLAILPSPNRYANHQTAIASLAAALLGSGLWLLPEENNLPVYALLTLMSAVIVTLWERKTAFIFILISVIPVSLILFIFNRLDLSTLTKHISLLLFCSGLIETIFRLKQTMRARIKRLEILNNFSRQIGTSLESEQVINLVNAALQKAIDADSYYLGIYENNYLTFSLLYDDGEFFSNLKVPLAGTLSGWVIAHQKPLFLPDLRSEAELEGVNLILAGQGRTSLSWMGVPMITDQVKGILAIASYQPNAFNQVDLELLENLGQQAALALDNAHHHSQVEKQARLDSLTQVYNHGYFLKLLAEEAERAKITKSSLCLVMLDIDYFKQYNDNYGHLVGDQVLITLTQIIAEHIHLTDAIGRWGGEEFAILFPNTHGAQVYQITQRIRQKINNMSLTGPNGTPLPLPTISQGIAVYPDEADQIMPLVDLADQRLYIAKERGRNQIDPQPEHWQKIAQE